MFFLIGSFIFLFLGNFLNTILSILHVPRHGIKLAHRYPGPI